MGHITGYKRWLLNIGLMLLAAVMLMMAIFSSIEEPHPVTIGFAIVFGGLLILSMTTFLKEMEHDKGTA